MKRIFLLSLLIGCGLLTRATTWIITSSGLQFTPASITINYGDSVLFQLDTFDNAQEVTYAAWIDNDSIPVIGFDTPDSGGLVTGLDTGTHYFVSNAHAWIGMKGEITVLQPAVIQFTTIAATVPESGSPVPVIIEINNPGPDTASFIVQQDTSGATARYNIDYSFTQQFIYSPPGVTFDTVVYITPIDDEIIGPPKTAKLDLNTFSSNAIPGPDSIFTLTILDNDTLFVSFLGAAFSYLKGADTAYVGVTISSIVAGTTSVTVVLDSGSAVRGVDFDCADTTVLTFPADSIDTLYVPVMIYQDSMVTGNLQINFGLINPTNGAQLVISGYTIFIIDNDTTAGIEPVSLNEDLSLFPNPATEFLNVQTAMELKDAEVIDLYGRQALNAGTIAPGTNHLDVSNLPAGMYFLVGKAMGYTLAKRFVVQ